MTPVHRLLVSDHAMIVYVACVVAVVAAVPAMRRREWRQAMRIASVVLLVGAILTVLSTTLRGSTGAGGRVNLVPGASIGELFSADYRNAFENVVGNIALFLPLGFFAIIVTRLRVLQVTLAAAVFSAFIELTQLALGDRWVDVDDLLLNTTGALVGAVVATWAKRLVPVLEEPSRPAPSDR
jgi:glycopeptide antibiotics resistance protein